MWTNASSLPIGSISPRATSRHDNDTLVVFATTAVEGGELAFDFGAPADVCARFYAASNATLKMGGGYWTLHAQDVRQTLITPDGHNTSRLIFGKPVSGPQNVTSPKLAVGYSLVYTKVERAW